ncbi:MAG: hypothetical protein DMG13_11640 [Acidobacteria bacterium]|nr:MAG: hypothetical protein DMG13_11640 [Acidobacteriota bacterium]
MLPILILLILVVTFGLFISAGYFFVQAPLAKQKLRARLTAVHQANLQAEGGVQAEIMRREMLSDIPALSRILAAAPFVARLQLLLQQGAVEMQVSVFLLIVVSIALFSWIGAIVANVAFLATLAVPIVTGSIPFLVVAYKRQRRFRRFEEIFPDAIDLLARAVRAGHAFTTAFSLIGEEMPNPLAEEFRLTYQQHNLGLPLRDALANLATRMPLPDVRIFISALQIQRDTGGNLGEILDNLSEVIRERFSILREIQIVTAEGRLSMYVLTAIPVAAGVLMYLANPDYMMPLFTDPIGHIALGVAAVMQFIGYLIIKKMVAMKI